MSDREYPRSKQTLDGSILYMARHEGVKSLWVWHESPVYHGFQGQEVETGDGKAKVCPLTHANANALRQFFPFTAPVSHQGRGVTMGLGDRLGLASPGHIRLIRELDIFPVLAQQSIRELTLTGRTFEDVLDSATWAVFQEGYTKGFGADGDHLKTDAEVETALHCGFTMITLDCSEHIRNDVVAMDARQVGLLYEQLPEPQRTAWERAYLNRAFTVGDGVEIVFSPEALQTITLAYGGAVKHTASIYHEVLCRWGRTVDFEVSIDETLSTTSPQAHYFVARELEKAGVQVTSIAPRFCGEFQKGIDYKGDVEQFAEEFIIHTQIARHFGYKLSVHSGSDKFTVFPIIGRESGGRFHLKTAGTNWLEALRVIAAKNPALFRRLARFALAHLGEAKQYYHITENTDNIPDLETLADEALVSLLDMDDSRQVLHVTYGQILLAEKGALFGDAIMAFLEENESDYYDALAKHIGRHLTELGLWSKAPGAEQ